MCSSNFITKCKLFFKVIVLISSPTNSVWNLSLLHIPANTSYFQIVNFTTLVCILGCQWFLFSFQVVNKLKHADIFLLVVCISFFEVFVQLFHSFFNCVVSFSNWLVNTNSLLIACCKYHLILWFVISQSLW